MTMTDPNELAALLGNLEVGEWAVCADPPNKSWYRGLTIYNTNRGTRVADACCLDSHAEQFAAFIAAAHNAMPELLRLARIGARAESAKQTAFGVEWGKEGLIPYIRASDVLGSTGDQQ